MTRPASFSVAALSLLLAACVGGPVAPGYPPGNAVPYWKVIGLGTDTCARFNATARGSPEREAYRQWLLGYLTAYNVQAPSTAAVIGIGNLNYFDNFKTSTYFEWLEDFCRTNPDVPFHVATQRSVAREYSEMQRQERVENGRMFPF